jgi:hypothetical protein
MIRLRALRGKVKPKKGEGKRALLKSNKWDAYKNFFALSSLSKTWEYVYLVWVWLCSFHVWKVISYK